MTLKKTLINKIDVKDFSSDNRVYNVNGHYFLNDVENVLTFDKCSELFIENILNSKHTCELIKADNIFLADKNSNFIYFYKDNFVEQGITNNVLNYPKTIELKKHILLHK